MRILIAHNEYQYRGGEDEAVAADELLLRSHGHEVLVLKRPFRPVDSKVAGLKMGSDALWSVGSYSEVERAIHRFRPDIAHFHNVFPSLSPSVYRAAGRAGVPVVQTLHNYRLICVAGTLLRDGLPCEACVGRSRFPGIRYRCYRDSYLQSAALTAIITAHTAAGSFRRIDAFIALTAFSRGRFIAGGLPASKVFVRPNAVLVPTPAQRTDRQGAAFIGRLSSEKGIEVLLRAAPHLRTDLTVIGDGPLLESAARRAEESGLRVHFVGRLSRVEALERLAAAEVLIFPSISYEGLPLVLLEALALGVPVVASDIGSQKEIITDGIDGLLVPPGDAKATADAVNRIVGNSNLSHRLSAGAVRTFASRYSLEISYSTLMSAYSAAVESRTRRSR